MKTQCKLLSLVLVLGMLIGILAGCSDTKSEISASVNSFAEPGQQQRRRPAGELCRL